jgi:hypothetical protein
VIDKNKLFMKVAITSCSFERRFESCDHFRHFESIQLPILPPGRQTNAEGISAASKETSGRGHDYRVKALRVPSHEPGKKGRRKLLAARHLAISGV